MVGECMECLEEMRDCHSRHAGKAGGTGTLHRQCLQRNVGDTNVAGFLLACHSVLQALQMVLALQMLQASAWLV